MTWTDQNPPAHDVVLSGLRLKPGPGVSVLQIDKLADGTFRLTGGDLFGSEELARHHDLEKLLRLANLLASYTHFSSIRATIDQFKKGAL